MFLLVIFESEETLGEKANVEITFTTLIFGKRTMKTKLP
jgi:hypothetical protein